MKMKVTISYKGGGSSSAAEGANILKNVQV